MGKEVFTSEWFDTTSDLIQSHQLEPLDVISFKRTGLITYLHYAVVLSPFVGPDGSITDYNCIHVTDADGLTSGMKRLRIQKLSEVAADPSVFGQAMATDTASDGTLKPSQVRIHNLCERQDKGAKERIEEALQMDGKEIKYELLWSNCEHFSNKLRSDMRFSGQILNLGVEVVNLGVNLYKEGLSKESLRSNLTKAFSRWEEKM